VDRGNARLNTVRRAGGLERTQVVVGKWRAGRVVDHGDTPDCGSDLLNEFQPFAADRRFDVDVGEPRDVAARPCERRDKTAADRIGDLGKHDRERARFPQERSHSGRSYCEDDVRLQPDQFLSECPQSIGIANGLAIVDVEVAALAPTPVVEGFSKCSEVTFLQTVFFTERR
jgi:hypothetical protein